MKKLFLSLLFVSSIIFSGFSQSLALYDSTGLLANNANISRVGLPTSDEIVTYLFVKNISNQTVNVKVKKVELSLVEGAMNVFCWGLCFAPSVYVSPDPKAIMKDSINKNDFSGHYLPSGFKGNAVIRYVFFNNDNPSDTVCVTVTYHANPLGIENIPYSEGVSNPYPNPANQQTTFNFSLQSAGEGKLIIRNLLGSKVKEMGLQGNNGNVALNTSDLPDGIYFYTLLVNEQVRSTRKLIVKH